MSKYEQKLSDGTFIRVKVEQTIAGTYFHEVPSRKRKANSMMRLGNSMFMIAGPRQAVIPVRHPDYDYAASDDDGARKALAMFVEVAESCIKHAEQEGIPVEACYSTD
ncbi:hypothetical protein ACWDBD_38770 [Streptomyces sp. NPDC001118]|uniref:hypothetical protein n=1 Tax=Streptomyces sp. NPDC001127 TaxID=3154377 RepID=UPI003333D7C5